MLFVIVTIIAIICYIVKRCRTKSRRESQKINWKELEKVPPLPSPIRSEVIISVDSFSGDTNRAQRDNNSHASQIDLSDIAINIPAESFIKPEDYKSTEKKEQASEIEFESTSKFNHQKKNSIQIDVQQSLQISKKQSTDSEDINDGVIESEPSAEPN